MDYEVVIGLEVHAQLKTASKIFYGCRTAYGAVPNTNARPLIEIVGEPDMSSTEQAVTYFKKLRSILCYVGISEGNMEEGSFRCDANLSLRWKGTEGFGTRTGLPDEEVERFSGELWRELKGEREQ